MEVVCNWMRCERLPYDIINDSDLKDIKIESLIQLYEKIEEILYPQIENRYTSRFSKALTKTQNAALEEFIVLSKGENLLEIILQGLRRFLLRYLDESLDAAKTLKNDLAIKEGLWPLERFKEISLFIEEKFPDEICIENIITIIQKIDRVIKKDREKSK